MKQYFKRIQCDNAGENKTLKENYVMDFEKIIDCTLPGIPEQNEVVYWVFVTLYSYMHVVIVNTGLHENLTNGPWNKCAATATKCKNIMVNPEE